VAKFKDYVQDQMMLLPPSVGDKIDSDHIARFISKAIDRMSLAEIEQAYSELGCRAYHPRMLLKLLVYGYCVGVRSSRKIQQKTREDLVFMWLAGMQEPDFRTISDFRKLRLLNLKTLFCQVLEMCQELGMIQCGRINIDGTKLAANCSRNKLTYRKMLERRKHSLTEEIDRIFDEAEAIDQEEDRLYGDKDGYMLDRVYTDAEIDQALKNVERKKKQIEKKKVDKQNKKAVVEAKLERLGDRRNSYGTTDPDSTLMQMKEGHLGPGYNIQMATERQVIVGYGVFENRNDVQLLEPMVKEVEQNLGTKPEVIIADKGYASESNYTYLEQRKLKAAIPHPTYDYDRRALKNGSYQPSQNANHSRQKLAMMRYLETTEGKSLMNSRKQDIEPTFGDIKHNMGFRKLLLRLKPKVSVEIGLIAIAHNIKKMRSYLQLQQIDPVMS